MTQGSLAERLRVLRAQHGLSLTEASEKIGVNRHTLRDLELGKREPYGPTIRKIAVAYGVPVARLLEERVLLGKDEAPDTGPPPRVSKERLEEHFEDVRWDEVDYLNWMISDFWRLALPDEKPQAHFVPEDIDSDRVWGFLEHALGARNVFEPEEAERIKRGALRKAALAR
jgi:transcriptional regulator with XRE-family HTH domain